MIVSVVTDALEFWTESDPVVVHPSKLYPELGVAEITRAVPGGYHPEVMFAEPPAGVAYCK